MIKFDRNSALIVVIVAGLMIATFMASIYFELPFAFRPPSVITDANYDAFNQSALADGAIGTVGIDFPLQVLAPSVAEPERKLVIKPYNDLSIYVRDDSPTVDVESVCVDSIILVVSQFPFPFDFLSEPYCHTFEESDWLGDAPFSISKTETMDVTNLWYSEIPLSSVTPYETDWPETVGYNFWFPYDRFETEVNIQAVTTLTLTNGSTITETIPMYYSWKVHPSGSRPWDVSMQNSIETAAADSAFVQDNFFYEGYYNQTTINFSRPLLFLLSFPIVLLAMVFAVSVVPSMTEASIDSILGVQTGLLFANFAIRSILSPGGELTQTLVEIAVVGLTILQVFAIIVLVIRIIRKKMKETKTT